jgi:MFS family permease
VNSAGEIEEKTRRRVKQLNRLALATLLVSATLTVMASAVIGPGLNLMRAALDVDPATAGLILTTHGLLITIVSPLMGRLIDTHGHKKVMTGGLVLFAISGGAGLVMDAFWPLIVSRVFLGIGVAAFYNSITVAILASYQGQDRNRVMGLRGSANSFGSVIWPLLGGALAGLSWHAPFAVYLVALPLALLTYLSFPDFSAGKPPGASAQPERISLVRILAENRTLITICVTMFLANVMLYANVVFVPTLLEQIGMANPRVIGLYFGVLGLAGGTVGLLYRRIRSDRSYGLMVIISLVLWNVSFFTTFISRTPTAVAVGLALFGAGFGIMTPTVMVWVGDIGPPTHRGTISSYLGTFGYLAQFLSPILFAPVLRIGQPRDVFLAAGLICAVFCLVFVSMVTGRTGDTA